MADSRLQAVAFLGTIFSILEGSPQTPAPALQYHIIGQPWHLLSSTLSKVSICLFFAAILRRARHWRIILIGLVTIVVLVNLAYALAFYLQCRPLERVWNPEVTGTCTEPSVQANFSYAQGGTLVLITYSFRSSHYLNG